MNLRFEKFTDPQIETIKGDWARLERMARKTANAGNAMTDWFGAASRTRLTLNLKKMRDVIFARDRSITFVNRAGGRLKVKYHSLLNPELLPVGHPGEALEEYDPVSGDLLGGAVAYAFPVNRFNERTPIDQLGTMSHVGSGMRLYLTSIYFGLSDKERSATIYHELTHKVLACEDYCYDATDCHNLASTPSKAIRNADNYAMFLLSL